MQPKIDLQTELELSLLQIAQLQEELEYYYEEYNRLSNVNANVNQSLSNAGSFLTPAMSLLRETRLKNTNKEFNEYRTSIERLENQINILTSDKGILLNENVLLKAELESSKTELEDSKAELEISKAELEISKAELEISKAELEISKAELEISKAELESSKAELEISKAELEDSKAELEINKERFEKQDKSIQEKNFRESVLDKEIVKVTAQFDLIKELLLNDNKA